MKILTILPRIPFPAHDGGSIVMLETLRQLHRAGHHVDVLVLNTKKHHQDPAAIAGECRSVHAFDIDTSLSVRGLIRGMYACPFPPSFGIDVDTSYWVSRFADEDALTAFREIVINNGPYDLIFCESLFTACYGIALRSSISQTIPTPVMVRAHNVENIIQSRLSNEPSRSRIDRWYRSRLARFTRTFETYVGRSVDVIATVTEDDAEIFRSYLPTAVVDVVQPGVNIPGEYFGYVDPDAICLLGSLDWAPNIEGALWFVQKVFPIIREQRPSTTVHIAGRNPSSTIQALHNGTSIFVHGEIEDALAFRRERSLSVVPVFSGSGLRIKILEALAASSPVVSTSVGCEGIGVVHDGEVLIADDARGFAEACVRVLNNSELAHRLAISGLALVRKRYGWSNATDRLLALGQRVSDALKNPEPAAD
ncbi:MAG TPA: glycosyltransferase family 4 protein [Candidatus Didemnitutus sp.]|nr:glycosyltransferase family 4 protein [Candidatus Didemnitutus sp.]